ncbi:hypothetical protein NLI96_g4760 [Meripilus lineatus]|uniref:Cullin family profile domain-containing protein n=1 Tax=Meripilus lineatus TaxID=2056292 RepID=A0AAD5V6J7_9APHY|nr:hypothetical protein NLI96_g4760 [Physisporinus lineatus]
MTTTAGALSMPPAGSDLHTTWAYLEDGLDYIMTKLPQGTSYSNYMGLYTVIYNYTSSAMVESGESAGQAQGSMCLRFKRDLAKDGLNPAGYDLYHRLSRYFGCHLKNLLESSDGLQGEVLLRFYAQEWDRYTTAVNYINRIFTHFNQHWVKGERYLALALWKSNYFLNVQTDNRNLTGTVLRLIERQRNGEMIDRGLVKKVVGSFVSLGLDKNDISKVSYEVYKDHFETPFLEETDKYYHEELKAFLAENSVHDYLKKAEERLRQEEDRLQRDLSMVTRKEMMKILYDVFVNGHKDVFLNTFKLLFLSDPYGVVRTACKILNHFPGQIGPFQSILEERVKSMGLDAVRRLVGENVDENEDVDTTAYVHTLLHVHRMASGLISHSFSGRAKVACMTNVDKACREFINHNAATGSSSTKSAKHLARYADALLGKNNKMAGEDLEDALDTVIVLLKYIDDKDVFLALYTTKLSKRLIHGISASDEAEASMISKLEEACGFEYTNKLKRMFMDVRLSKDLTDQCRERMQQKHDDMDITFSVMVLGTNVWPLHPPDHALAIPADLIPTYERFSKYFQKKHSGRRLTWLWNYSTNELRTNYLNHQYILVTSSWQMAVLLQYNNNDRMSLDELCSATNISKESLKQALAPLLRSKILVNKEMDQYHLNPDFRSKKTRINLNKPIKADQKSEATEILTTVNEGPGRRYLLQASIIRAQDDEKSATSSNEVITQISQRFTPKIPDIKKAIDHLLEKEYIERVEGTRDTFAYVA